MSRSFSITVPGRCQIEGCSKPVKARGWCSLHYSRWRRRADPLAPRKVPVRRKEEPIVRFERSIHRMPLLGCWEWTANRDRDGYGTFVVDRRPRRAHRWSYEYFVGPIPPGLQIDQGNVRARRHENLHHYGSGTAHLLER